MKRQKSTSAFFCIFNIYPTRMYPINASIFSLIVLLLSSCNQPNYKKEAIKLNNKGTQFYLKNEKDSALFYFTLAAEKNPQYQIALQNKVNALISLQQYEPAILAIDNLIKLHPYAEAFTIKGMLLDKTNKSNEALTAYQEGIKKFEERLSSSTEENKNALMIDLAQLHFLKGDTVKAKNILLEQKDLNSDFIDKTGITDTILNNLNNKVKFIEFVLNKVG